MYGLGDDFQGMQEEISDLKKVIRQLLDKVESRNGSKFIRLSDLEIDALRGKVKEGRDWDGEDEDWDEEDD